MDYGFRSGSRALLDSSALVYLVESVPRRGDAVRRFLDALRSAGGQPFASVLVMAELLAGSKARGDEPLTLRYRRFLADCQNIVLVPVDAQVSEAAAGLLAAQSSGRKGRPALSLADAVHLATARVHTADAILTNDEAWRAAASTPGDPEIFLVDELVEELE